MATLKEIEDFMYNNCINNSNNINGKKIFKKHKKIDN